MRVSLHRVLAVLAAQLAVVGCDEVPSTRDYFYVGGQYVKDSKGEHVLQNQMYVERLVPIGGAQHETPLVLIHGKGQTGTNWLNKPDGGRGWASDFIDEGYEVYIVDQTFRGRSAWHSTQETPIVFTAERTAERFTNPAPYELWAQAVKHTQWPGTGEMGDPIFDAFHASNVQFVENATYTQLAIQDAGAKLLERIGKPVMLIGHSQGGIMPTIIADARPQLTRGLVLLEPTGPPFREAVFSNKSALPWGLTDIPMTYDPPVTDPETELRQQWHPPKGPGYTDCVLQKEFDDEAPRKLINLMEKPILVVTGEASYHAAYDYCTAAFLKQAGCEKTTHVELQDVGILGNGHMLFLEKNSREISDLVAAWISKVEEG